MGLEPTTFCMAIVCTIRISACLRGSRVNPITGDYRGFGVYWSPNGPPGHEPLAQREALRRHAIIDDAHLREESDHVGPGTQTPGTRRLPGVWPGVCVAPVFDSTRVQRRRLRIEHQSV